ncbi:hypothetical protein HRR83_005455 [Exophiala dermatitidis]|uniref:Acyl-coenzyme A diphosphatase SCS3 n=2 Tax=Exophiala dermatitidis TaxID=5970 RepID=H6C4G4_EXODN|nr:uncharacterized protein HMPREF1120_05666 [Exophiala dermatitidis NIH/UT8656]KAJ4513099.1 hypothetical protein HRR75_004866 [Exophiala dermatitidis]EHY57637.1 hypothetical protein HMPREF1120_05666 [Exophiala dermatitidis NIH/UT8656]KAJ4516151.1 hypothetical protein HRR74_005308 [Exophiala dermatitidis]KAJ4518443.1 hypothetical protein HRR73_004024 [Exophiala dermatitidis]KAJ4533937.1 hypothetical protein HRR76_005888 [Exophiala dermatitidis]
MPAVQRNGRAVPSEKQDEPAEERLPSAMTVSQEEQERPSPYLLIVYPIILSLGSLWSVISPAASPPPTAPLAAGVTSDLNPPHFHQTNYFAGKRNLINIYFVKMGWFWSTLAFVLLQATTRPRSSIAQKHYIQAGLRYALVTLSWFLTTQWCFGPALIDRSFTITGGHCEPHPFNEASLKDAVKLSQINSGVLCKAYGGNWHGGHDISGHVFMLVLSSAFLLYELYIADRHSAHPHVSPQAAAAVAHNMTEEERKAVGGWESETAAKIRIWSRYFVYAVVALDLWMLMMTAIWFHTWLEKLSGLLIAGSTIWAVFFLGDFVPQWRQIVGGV